MNACQSLSLNCFITEYYQQQIDALSNRVNQSVAVLEQYCVSTPPPPPPIVTTAAAHITTTPKGRSRRPPKHLNGHAARLLDAWFAENVDNPYPDQQTVKQLATQGMISPDQVKKWFCNKRSRTANTRSFNEIVKLRKARKQQDRL